VRANFHGKALPFFYDSGPPGQRGLHRLSRETVFFLFLLALFGFFFFRKRSENYIIFVPNHSLFQEKDEECPRDLLFFCLRLGSDSRATPRKRGYVLVRPDYGSILQHNWHGSWLLLCFLEKRTN